MSGASLAAGPRERKHEPRKRGSDEGGGVGGLMGSLRIVELQLVAFIVVFSASGLVPVMDLAFPIFLSIYAFILSHTAFPKFSKSASPELFKGSRIFQLYVVTGTIIGLFLPLAYVLGGFARGDQSAVRAATPHLFLLSFQVLSENLINGMNVFSLPVRAVLPILYTGRRLFALTDWLNATFAKAHVPVAPIKFTDNAWLWFGRGLAVANFVYFAFNLFGFLIPAFLPRALDHYFEERNAHNKEVAQKKPVQNGQSKEAVTANNPAKKAA
eukprot:TRINITY_DN20639_c0_g1_i1.p1 TRINITY_DN20639_c0_g1~~TRINITY_DN20639_c0_g1_i1.p1  ORF type:complete len:270 (-),score=28.95 TRINITY_DN20639_c0_g1_i1:609-1418(-)